MELRTTFASAPAGAGLALLRTWSAEHEDQAIVTLSLSLSLLLGRWRVGKSRHQIVR
ncbi:hypothetical protein ACIQOV_19150 [Kitasatospora sp. NPDC091257]|uniref:hypothetical protein n=1 Tax=Kitasatospora sp. NPDC091257 TaxID=3364084 RepID=UPI00381096D3